MIMHYKFKRVMTAMAILFMTLQNATPAFALSTSKVDVEVKGDGVVNIKNSDADFKVDKDNPFSLDVDVGSQIDLRIDDQDGLTVSSITLNDESVEDFKSGSAYSHSFVINEDSDIEVTFDKVVSEETPKVEESKPVESELSEKPKEEASKEESKEANEKIRLVVEGNPENKEEVTSQYGNLYVLEYASQQDADQAKSELTSSGVKVDSERLFTIAQGETISDVVETEKVDDAIIKANEKAVKNYAGQNVIALIDTGSNGSTLDAISFVDENASDNNGHATRMLQSIYTQNKDAKVIALKALDDNGNGTTASVVAALQYAIDSKVSIINLSLSSSVTEDTKLITSKINEAIDQGIQVVVSAGNNGSDASNFVPANIGRAITVGAVNEKGVILPSSNYGEVVDWYVNASATSGAAATISGILSKGEEIKEDKKVVFATPSVTKEASTPSEENSDKISADDSGGAGGGSGSGGITTSNGGVAWTIHDNNDNGFGLAGTEGNPNVTAVRNAMRNMGVRTSEEMWNYPNFGADNGVLPSDTLIARALAEAIAQCRTNYRSLYHTENGFKPRIVAIGVAYGDSPRGKEYNGTSRDPFESDWLEVWNYASSNRNLTLYHNNQAYKVDSRFHNGTQSLTGFALEQLKGRTNIRIIVLDETQPLPAKGKVKINKVSANPIFTENNNCYATFEGAQYGLFKDKATSQRAGVFTLDVKGNSNTIEDLDPGTYYIKELKAPKGYALDPTVYSIEVKAGETASKQFEDAPQSDPVGILLGKVDRQTNQNKPQGSATLQNAEFTVKFYKGFYTSDPAKQGVRAERTWILKTNENGYARLDPRSKVSGDDFYYNGTTVPTLPLGTLTIQETKAPEGYYISNEVFVRQITADGSRATVETYNQPTVQEQVMKLHVKKVQEGTNVQIPGTIFRHTKPDGSTENLTTDSQGYIHIVGLETGRHSLQEVSVMDGYEINTTKVDFEVTSGKGVRILTDLSGTGISQSEEDKDITLTVEDKVSPFDVKIVKTNEDGKLLNGAEFTLYEDPACTKELDKQVSKNGVLQFNGLKDRTHYYMKETKAPKGYRIPLDPDTKMVHVYDIYTESTPALDQFDFTVDGARYSVNNINTDNPVHLEGTKAERVVTVNVINKKGFKLPKTGSSWTAALSLIGTLAMIIGLIAYKNRKRED